MSATTTRLRTPPYTNLFQAFGISNVVWISALCLVSKLATFRLPIYGTDEAILLSLPERMSRGEVPNVDFFTVYGPGGFELLQIVYLVATPSLFTERVVGAIYQLTIVAAVMLLTRMINQTASVAAGFVCVLVLFWLPPIAFAWMGGLALVMISLAILASRRSPWAIFLAGVFAGLVPAWRVEMAILCLSCLPLLRLTNVKYFLGGVGVGLTPVLFHLLRAGGPMIANMFHGGLSLNEQTTLSEVSVTTWAIILLSFVSIIFMCARVVQDSANRRILLAMVILSIGVLPQMLQRIDVHHAIYASCIILPFAAATLVSATHRSLSIGTFTRRSSVGAMAFLALVSLGAGFLPVSTTVVSGERTILQSPEAAKRIDAVIAAVHRTVPRGAVVFYGPADLSRPGYGDPELYHLLPEYRAQAYFQEMAPGVAEKKGSRLLDDVMSADALVLTQFGRSVLPLDLPNVGPGDDSVNIAVATYFCTVETVGPTQVMKRC